MGDHDDHAILKRLYLMPECEREAMNYLCGRADGMVFIEHAMDAQWGISRAQNGRINDDFSDGDVDFEDEFQVDKFPYGMEAFSAVSDFDYVKLWAA
ncbi:hypothetical protein B0T09DRAFT_268102 [Sordaria sp. MPI-SDFR-AT-0083]|nr:hypothetical protein B0T09DRAFT_268102 [Sordaria sp. MPI-SDFR-AT-0083]